VRIPARDLALFNGVLDTEDATGFVAPLDPCDDSK